MSRKGFSVMQLRKPPGSQVCKECTAGDFWDLHCAGAARCIRPEDSARYGESWSDASWRTVVIAHKTEAHAIQQLASDAADADLVAFDAEWLHTSPPSAGAHVLQLAFPAAERVYVVQLLQVGQAVLEPVHSMLRRQSCLVVGWGIECDTERFPSLRGRALDIQPIACLAAFHVACQRRLDEVVQRLLQVHMDKSQEVTLSDWSQPRLSQAQVRYAVQDVVMTLRLYLHLACDASLRVEPPGAKRRRLSCSDDEIHDGGVFFSLFSNEHGNWWSD